nr:hypothetical protein [Tanacetum cinerariifolium]
NRKPYPFSSSSTILKLRFDFPYSASLGNDPAPQEPFVFNQDPCENSLQSPPQIDHQCCYGCGDSLDGIFCQRCTYENSSAYDLTPDFVNDSSNVFNPPSQPPMYSYEFYGNDAQYGHDCPPQKIPICYDDDDDEESFIPLRDIIISELPPCIAITPILSTKETKDSLIMRDEHLDTISEKELDKFIKSSVENLVLNAKIISIKIDPHHFSVESDLIESLLNQDSSITSSSKIDSILDEFAGEFILLKSIPPGINEANCDSEEEIRLIKKLLYDNSFPRPPEEINSKSSNAVIKSFSPSPIPVKDSDSLTEEIDLSLTPYDSMPPAIKNDDYESEGDILILEELLSNDSLSLPENESFHFDIPSSRCPPAKPPNDDEIKPIREF